MDLTFTELLAVSNALRRQIGSQKMEIAEGKDNPVIIANIRENTEFLEQLKGKFDSQMATRFNSVV